MGTVAIAENGFPENKSLGMTPESPSHIWRRVLTRRLILTKSTQGADGPSRQR